MFRAHTVRRAPTPNSSFVASAHALHPNTVYTRSSSHVSTHRTANSSRSSFSASRVLLQEASKENPQQQQQPPTAPSAAHLSEKEKASWNVLHHIHNPQQAQQLHPHHHPGHHHKPHYGHGGMHGAKHQLQHRVKEKVGMKVAEKTVTAVMPRLFAVKKRLGIKLITRKLARGVAIALPAVGGIFACIVTFADMRRAFLERGKANTLVAGLFGVAAAFDVIDAFAHLYTAMGLMEFIHAHEHSIHLAEEISLGAAVLATASAIAGEVFTPVPPTHTPPVPSPSPLHAIHDMHNHKANNKTDSATTTTTDTTSTEKTTETTTPKTTQKMTSTTATATAATTEAATTTKTSSTTGTRSDSKELKVPRDLHRYIIGTKGATIQQIQSESGAKITIPDSDIDTVTVTGTPEAIEAAERAINDIVNEQKAKQQKYAEYVDGDVAAAETDKLYKQYQDEVNEHAKKRSELFEAASKAYESGDKALAAKLRDQGKVEGELMEKAQKKASRAIFNAKNAKFDKLTIDLHGLHLEEALELLQERIDELNKEQPNQTLVVIYGAGNHSDERGPLMKPATQKFLKEKGLAFTEVNSGSVSVTL